MKLLVTSHPSGGIEFSIDEHPGPSLLLLEDQDVIRMFNLEPWKTHLLRESELAFLLDSVIAFLQPHIYLGFSGKSWKEKFGIMKSLRSSGYFKETDSLRGLPDSVDSHKEYYPILQKLSVTHG